MFQKHEIMVQEIAAFDSFACVQGFKFLSLTVCLKLKQKETEQDDWQMAMIYGLELLSDLDNKLSCPDGSVVNVLACQQCARGLISSCGMQDSL